MANIYDDCIGTNASTMFSLKAPLEVVDVGSNRTLPLVELKWLEKTYAWLVRPRGTTLKEILHESMGFIPWLQNLINSTFPSYFNDFDGDISQFFVHP
jgi:hypothetical protein